MKLCVLIIIMAISQARLPSFYPEGPSQSWRPFITHPVSKQNFWDKSIVNGPLPTNAWFQNFVLGSGTATVNLYSYMVQAYQDQFKISVDNKNRDVHNPDLIISAFNNDWQISAQEGLSNGRVSYFDELTAHYTYGSGSSSMVLPLVMGQAFMTVLYNGLTPKLTTIAAVIRVKTETGTYNQGQQTEPSNYFTIELNSGDFWIVYVPVKTALFVQMSGLVFPTAISGFVQLGCMGQTDITDAIKPYLGSYPLLVELDYSWNENTFSIQFNFKKEGLNELLLMALPHHIEQLQNFKYLKEFTLHSIKGDIIGVVGDKWTLTGKLPNIDWYAPTPIDSDKKAQILAALKVDAAQPLPDPNDNDPYWMGLKCAKFARLILIAEQLGEQQIADTLRKGLEGVMIPWLTGQSRDQLQYDTTWGGIVSSWGIRDKGADYGQGYYNDHHFHYGYHVYVLAVIIKGDRSFYDQYKQSILDLVQDYANPDYANKFFTVTRNKDWYSGHSWANGLFEFADGRNGESSSESVNSYYALRLMGMALGNDDMKNFGSMLLATEMQAVKYYWHMPSSSKIYDEIFKNNKMVGMVWSQKVDHLTWFGTDDIYVHGINMLPFTPITELLLDYPFVSEQYPVLASKGSRDETWNCYAICDQAIIDKNSAWSRALQVQNLHEGNSKTNMFYWIATRPLQTIM